VAILLVREISAGTYPPSQIRQPETANRPQIVTSREQLGGRSSRFHHFDQRK
jgi:hypothetical protein